MGPQRSEEESLEVASGAVPIRTGSQGAGRAPSPGGSPCGPGSGWRRRDWASNCGDRKSCAADRSPESRVGRSVIDSSSVRGRWMRRPRRCARADLADDGHVNGTAAGGAAGSQRAAALRWLRNATIRLDARRGRSRQARRHQSPCRARVPDVPRRRRPDAGDGGARPYASPMARSLRSGFEELPCVMTPCCRAASRQRSASGAATFPPMRWESRRHRRPVAPARVSVRLSTMRSTAISSAWICSWTLRSSRMATASAVSCSWLRALSRPRRSRDRGSAGRRRR